MSANTQEAFLIYCREGASGRFYPLGRGGLAKNLVHAIQFVGRENADKALTAIRADNAEWTFELRTWKGKRIAAEASADA